MNLIGYLKEIINYDPHNPMIFNSGIFLLLFTIFITIYAVIYKNKKAVTIYVIAFSLLFYYKSSGWYLWILVFTTITDYSFAIAIVRAKQLIYKRIWLILSVGVSLGILAYFKYTNFFIENIDAVLKRNFHPLDIFLPIGISFYTFQSISYVLDVYWEKIKPTKNILDYAFFLSFFPQLVAGPIVKAKLFLPQLEKKINISKEAIHSGLWLIMVGLFKKAVIADYISQYNDLIFADPMHYSGLENLMGILGYTLQIYMDFSGYSDMAIGLGRIMGFDLGVNFNFPYKALNITDFWRRWHISLSSWLRDYVYIPLGGNRKGKIRMYINLFATMFVGGLWHGAAWKFVFWGAMHGIGLAVHKAFTPKLDKFPNIIPVKFIAWFITFVFVVFLWIFFRVTDIENRIDTFVVKDALSKNIVTNLKDGFDKTILTIKISQKDSLISSIKRTYKQTDTKIITVKQIKNEKNIEIVINEKTKAFDVAWIMIDKVINDFNIKLLPQFFMARITWMFLIIIGFLMHLSPQKLNEKIIESYIRSPYIIKLAVFIILVQLTIQFKLEGVQPFIYFQF
ncbi:MAG: MBOAT family protein [Bacteroidales bacterium]|nr:MBOAT family protein [Bacteroidales bacterium]MBN2755742.1 MBOAT family protein [Bacteroidales bacterium]